MSSPLQPDVTPGLVPGFANAREFSEAALALLGSAMMAVALSWDFFGGRQGMGQSETLLLGGGIALVLGATGIRYGNAQRIAEGTRFLAILVQVLLIYLTVRMYHIENSSFYGFIFVLVICGSLANHFLPHALRPAFFLAVSLVGLVGALGPANAAVLAVLGLVILGTVHLPVPVWARGAILAAIAGGLGLIRSGYVDVPQISVILPILASIFMFRLAIYCYDISNGRGPTNPCHRLSYFFMLPNFVFPFFPLVDYATWGRRYYSNGKELEILQRGAMWLFFGLVHLLLYRAVNRYLVFDQVEVQGFLSFLWYAATNFGLYLKISGLFHLILGCLHLYGYGLPETHSRFYLSFSFVEFWRRINIYWKDFLQKMIFNPTFAWTKRRGLGHQSSVVVSILVVFACTWVLHAYQWFWLRGSLLFSWPDLLFWTALAVFLVIQNVHEAQPARPGTVARIGARPLLVIRTIATMLTIVILWSMWSAKTIGEWFTLLAAAGFAALDTSAPLTLAGAASSVLFAGFLFVILAIAMGFTFGLAPAGSLPAPVAGARRQAARATSSIGMPMAVTMAAAALLIVQLPAINAGLQRDARVFAVDMALDRLSQRDQKLLERGYYENLTDVRSLSADLWNTYLNRPRNWDQIRQFAGVRKTDDYLEYELRPNHTSIFKGAALSTNSHGMRDREYTVEKPEGAIRVALLGASRTMGAGVSDADTFETVAEDLLNNGDKRVEILNFGVADYEAVRMLMVLDRKVEAFAPDYVAFVGHPNDLLHRHLSTKFQNGIERPYPFLDEALARAGVEAGMSRAEIDRRVHAASRDITTEIYRSVARSARSMGAQPIWVYLPSTKQYAGPEPDAEWLGELARAEGFAIVDLGEVYAGADVSSLWIAEWDHHPNAQAHRMIARVLVDALKPVLH